MPRQILPAASLRSAKRLPATLALFFAANNLIYMALWSIGRAIFRGASNFLPALREGRVTRRRADLHSTGVPAFLRSFVFGQASTRRSPEANLLRAVESRSWLPAEP
jgi:hypothetical protein